MRNCQWLTTYTIVAGVQARSPTNYRVWHGRQHGESPRPTMTSGTFWAGMSTEGGFAVPHSGTSTKWAMRRGEGSRMNQAPVIHVPNTALR